MQRTSRSVTWILSIIVSACGGSGGDGSTDDGDHSEGPGGAATDPCDQLAPDPSPSANLASIQDCLDRHGSAHLQPGTYPISVSGTGTGAIGSAEVSVTIVDPPPSTGGCSSAGPTGFAAALFGVLLATRLLRRRQGAQPCAALESNIVSE